MEVKRSVAIWLAVGCFLIFSMVIIGGITRLTNSGLSMVEWKLISGSLPPLNQEEWQVAFEKYKQFPEYHHVNRGFSLDEFKSIFWWEYLHRMIGRLLGVVFIIPYVIFQIKRMIPPALNKRLLVIFTLGALQGFFGWYMVKSGLVAEPDVSHYRLALHLITAFLTFSYVWWVFLNVTLSKNKDGNYIKPIHNWLTVFLLILVVQIIYGAFVAGLNAGFTYNTYPRMGEFWIAPDVTSLEPFWINFLEGVAGVQFVHRSIAVILVLTFVGLAIRVRKYQLLKTQKQSLKLLGLALIVQFLLGVFTLLYKVPIALGVIHQVGAFFLLAAVVLSLFRFSKNKTVN